MKGIENANLITDIDLIAADRMRKKVRDAKVLTVYLDYKIVQATNLSAVAEFHVQVKPISHLKPDYLKIY